MRSCSAANERAPSASGREEADTVTVIDGALLGEDEEFNHVAFLVNKFLPRPAFPESDGQVFASGYFAGKYPAIPAETGSP
jgi:hypothetical protein